jgi:hypothetical protein
MVRLTFPYIPVFDEDRSSNSFYRAALFFTSELALEAGERRGRKAPLLDKAELCKITADRTASS